MLWIVKWNSKKVSQHNIGLKFDSLQSKACFKSIKSSCETPLEWHVLLEWPLTHNLHLENKSFTQNNYLFYQPILIRKIKICKWKNILHIVWFIFALNEVVLNLCEKNYFYGLINFWFYALNFYDLKLVTFIILN